MSLISINDLSNSLQLAKARGIGESGSSIDGEFIVTRKQETTKPSDICKVTAEGSDPGLSYSFKLSCVAYHMTALGTCSELPY